MNINFIFEHWHGWQMANFMLSDERTKTLRSFPDIDHCINFLWLNGDKEAARVLNKLKNEGV